MCIAAGHGTHQVEINQSINHATHRIHELPWLVAVVSHDACPCGVEDEVLCVECVCVCVSHTHTLCRVCAV